MAKHLAQGKDFPIFFYGQHYALATVDAAIAAAAFRLFGVGPVPLKLSMLALWTVGILFVFLAQSRLVGPTRSFWITTLLVLNPAWAAWSMKAGGGYLTSFTAAAVLLWMMTSRAGTPDRDAVAGRRRADGADLSGAAVVAARRAADCVHPSPGEPTAVVGSRLPVGRGRRHRAGQVRDRNTGGDMGRAHGRQPRPGGFVTRASRIRSM